MRTPAVAHFGTTISEAAPAAGVDQRTVPITGALARTLEFLDVLGFRPHLENFYPGVGRQYIWRRGAPSDLDYVEQDNFTSYAAAPRPGTSGPRRGDVVFRLTHRSPLEVLGELQRRGLVELDARQAAEFARRAREWLLFTAPNGQRYELGQTQATAADNHVVYTWTAAADLERVRARFAEHFGVFPTASEDFHGIGRVERLRRERPGVTIGLLHSPARGLAPRWTDDIFAETGYSHFRLGALDKSSTEAATRQAFPPGGDVSFVYFEDSYLELVQA